MNLSIVLTRYNEPNALIKPCLEGLSKQEKVHAVIYFLDQKDDSVIRELCNTYSNKNLKFVYRVIPPISLSYARNEGLRLANTDIVLFVDSDAIPYHDWAAELGKILELDKNIGAVGGRSVPRWLKTPKWYNKSNIAGDVYSLLDLNNKVTETPKIAGVNFAINKKTAGEEAIFDINLGRRPGSLLGGEETDLCKRLLKKGLKIYYTPFAIVEHQVQEDRMSLRWLLRRFYYGGIGKAMLGGLPQTYSKKRRPLDILFILIIIIPYLMGYIKGRILRWYLKR